MVTAAASLTAAEPASSAIAGAIAGLGGGWAPLGGWIALTLVALPAAGKVVIVWLALRNTAPSDRPPIIKALADLLRPRGSTRCGPQPLRW